MEFSRRAPPPGLSKLATDNSNQLSLASPASTSPSSSSSHTSALAAKAWSDIEKEHMFDKVVTPSDVGKLNRLVIPKQHAEKYFPLDSSATEKGLLLCFEDRTGKQWRFRYSYWNSSQSYVMTKGWSRFVKEKHLDAGDTVSFSRPSGESGSGRFFIDWYRRESDRMSLAPLSGTPRTIGPFAGPWTTGASGRYFMPPPPTSPLLYGSNYHQRTRGLLNYEYGATWRSTPLMLGRSGGGMLQTSSSSPRQQFPAQQPVGSGGKPTVGVPLFFGSMPPTGSSSGGAKRVRLFGVNLDDRTPRDDTIIAADSDKDNYNAVLSLGFASTTGDGVGHHAPPSSSSARGRERHPLDLNL